MNIEQMVREILVAVQQDRGLLDALARGEDPREFTTGDIIGPANRLSELMGDLPGQASIESVKYIVR
jgi:hypothetical protein